ncbi:MAG: DUF4124 domain-containing protein [Pseudomonadota bacterium]|nr:DUF4124 domain-containing protein [Pseudomonadota bacterium]
MVKIPARISLFLIAIAAGGASVPALADVYKWVDAQGHTHYSDVPPGAGVKSESVLSIRPSIAPAADTPASGSANAKMNDGTTENPKASALRGKMIGVEQVDNSPEAQKQREEACQRMRTEMNLLGTDNRVFTLDANGERTYVDDDTRAARLGELKQQISAGCK